MPLKSNSTCAVSLYETAATRTPSSETKSPRDPTTLALNACAKAAVSHVCDPLPIRPTDAEASMTITMSARTSWHGVEVTVVVGDDVGVVVSQM